MALTYSHEEHQRRQRVSARQAAREKRHAIIADYKRALGCARCDEHNPDALDFHHLFPDNKRFTISQHLSRTSLATLSDEMSQCVILCANCHRKEHAT